MSDEPQNTSITDAPSPQVPTNAAPSGKVHNSFAELIGQGTKATAEQGPESQSPANPADTVPGNQAAQAAAEAQAAKTLREMLQARKFEIDPTIDDDEKLVDTLAEMIDSASAVKQDPTFKQFMEARDEFQQWKASKATTPDPKETTKKLLAEVPNLVQQQVLVNEDGKWVATNPAYTAHAEAANARNQKVRESTQKLVSELAEYDSPEQWLEARLEKMLESRGPKLPAEIEELKAHIQRTTEEQRITEVRTWVESNQSKLFAADGSLTEYGKTYQAYEASAPESLSDPLEKHQWVLSMLQPVAKFFEQPPQPQQPEAPKQSFIGAANRNGHNRLSGFTGPANAATADQPLPRGKGGLPDFQTFIAQRTQ